MTALDPGLIIIVFGLMSRSARTNTCLIPWVWGWGLNLIPKPKTILHIFLPLYSTHYTLTHTLYPLIQTQEEDESQKEFYLQSESHTFRSFDYHQL